MFFPTEALTLWIQLQHNNLRESPQALSTRPLPQNKEYLQNDQQAIPHSSVIFVAPYWPYRISCLKVQLAPLAQGADSEKWNIDLDLCKKAKKGGNFFDFFFFLYTFRDV